MCDYEHEQHLLRHLKVKNLPRKHLLETTGYKMSEQLYNFTLSILKGVIQSVIIISISVDEVTIVDNTS